MEVTLRSLLAMALLTAPLVAAPSVARADDTSAPRPAQGDELKLENGAFVIKGKVQKPQIVVAVRRQPLAAAIDLELKESFLHKIVEATQEPPF